MTKTIAFFKLIRLPNLLIIALTQYLMRWCIIKPMVNINDFELQLSEFDFFLLSISTVMIAAAGYIINDYFDIKIDRINKPEKIIVGRHIKRRVAMGAHIVINALAILISAYVSYKVGLWKYLLVFVFGAISLWYYATLFKRQLLVGNLVIAALAALVPLIVAMYEIPLLTNAYRDVLTEYDADFSFIAWWIFAYAGFAFLLTLAREITKDMADIKGDKQCGCNSLPIAFGTKIAKATIINIYIITFAALIYIQQRFLDDKITFVYLLFIAVLFVFLSYKTIKAKERTGYIAASTLNKLLTLAGILYAPVANYIIITNVGG